MITFRAGGRRSFRERTACHYRCGQHARKQCANCHCLDRDERGGY